MKGSGARWGRDVSKITAVGTRSVPRGQGCALAGVLTDDKIDIPEHPLKLDR
jgi:hypothetical protein